MNYSDICHASYRRTISTDPERFFSEFYDRFTAKSEIIAVMFKNTNMKMQRQSLLISLMQMIQFSESRVSDEEMEKLALMHKKLGIEGEHYEQWMNALIETFESVDSKHGKKESLAWRIILSPGIAFMKYFE